MANVKGFEKWVKLQGHKVKNYGTSHKEHTYEIPISNHSRDLANVKVFADGQAKNYMPPIFRYGGIKMMILLAVDFVTE
jgi:hypothetical protein